MAVHDLIVKNDSSHDQRFQVHGWNNNQDIVVKPRSEQPIKADDGSSGAIIAVHDGQIGEQAEITKHGFEGNDFIDLSNICGAGGNLIVMQVGEPSTAKGDPDFMQRLDEAWKKADAHTKGELKNCVTVKDGRAVRIAAPKDFPKLEAFVRTFADGRTYIGVGAWGGHAGNPNDNKQSSAAKGSKDILIIYSDDAIQIPSANGVMKSAAKPNHGTAEAEVGHPGGIEAERNEDKAEVSLDQESMAKRLKVDSHISADAIQSQAKAHPAAATAVISSNFVRRAADSGAGIELTNKSNKETEYFFYENLWNGNGTAGANFDKPLKSVKLGPNQSQFVSLALGFKGRVQRGTQLPCTWVEFQLEASDDHGAHGDISLQQGCDGAATIASTDGTRVSNGFTNDVLAGAPAAAIRKKPDGERAIDTTVGNWMGGPNKAAIEYLDKVVGQRKAYIVGGTGVPDVASKNHRLAVVMY